MNDLTLAKNKNDYVSFGFDTIHPEENIAIIPSELEATTHSHDFVEIVIFHKGYGEHTINENKFKIIPGDIYLINGNIEHSYNNNNNKQPICVTNIIFYPKLLDASLKYDNFISDYYYLITGKPLETPCDFIYLKKDINRNCFKIIELISYEMQHKELFYLDNIKYLLRSILDIFIKNIAERALPQKFNPSQKELAYNVVNYIETHYFENITLNSVARTFNYTPNYLNSILINISNTSFKKHLQSIRCKNACKMLKETSDSIYDICCAVGYTSLTHFTETFKREIGVTPSQYRKD